MTRVIIETHTSDAMREYADGKDGIEVYGDRVVVNGMAQHIRDVVNFMASVGLIDKPKPPRPVFWVRDPDGKRHQKISARNVYAYALVSRFDRYNSIQRYIDHFSNPKVVMAEYQRRIDLSNHQYSGHRNIGAELLEGYDGFDDFSVEWSRENIEYFKESIKDIPGYKVSFYTNIERAERAAISLPKQHRIYVSILETEREG